MSHLDRVRSQTVEGSCVFTRIRQFGAKVRHDFASYLLFAASVLVVVLFFLATIGRLLWSQDWSGLAHWVSAHRTETLSAALYALITFHVGMCIYVSYTRDHRARFFNPVNLLLIIAAYLILGHFVWPILINAAMLPILVTMFNLCVVPGLQMSDCVVYLAGLTLVAVVLYRPVRHVWRYISLRLALRKIQSSLEASFTIEDDEHLLRAYYAEKRQS
jgi:hypothetical protein